MPKVSIIIPVYNAEEYLGRLIKSLLKQDFEDYEVIFVNDGSKDDSLKVLKRESKKDKRIKVFSQKNQGIARTRNLGISVAKGKYIMFMDNDDWPLTDNYISRYVEEIETGNYDVVMGGYQRIDSNNKTITRRVWHILYSGRGATPEEFLAKNREIKQWLLEHSRYSTISPWSLKLSGEDLKTRLSVFMVRFFEKTHLLTLFAKVYCKGTER